MKKSLKILLPLLFCSLWLFAFTFQEPGGLKKGDMAPDFSVKDQDGKTFQLSEALKKGPVVLFFYRGDWCPYCNRYISNIQDSLHMITEKEASVAGISPDSPEGIESTTEKTAAAFPLLHDADLKISKAYKTYTEGSSLPVPATYVIGRDGKVLFVHYDKNYKKRSSAREILAAIP